MKLPPDFRKHLSKIGRKGGKARWHKVSDAKKTAHARAMLAARYAKRKNGA